MAEAKSTSVDEAIEVLRGALIAEGADADLVDVQLKAVRPREVNTAPNLADRQRAAFAEQESE